MCLASYWNKAFSPQISLELLKGGLQDIRTNRLREEDIRLIEEKWGAAVECRKRNKSGSSVNRILVKR